MLIKKFNNKRLQEALIFRGLRISDLSNKTGINKQSLSNYINEANIPSYENIKKIARELDFPSEFFMTEDTNIVNTDNIFFRSLSTATKLEQRSQKIKMEYVAKVHNILLNYVELPSLNLPKITNNLDINFFEQDLDGFVDEIEKVAQYVRKEWNLGDGPIDNLQYILESNGIIITSVKSANNDIDAFSQKIRMDNDNIFIIALVLGESPIERLRFDMGHELGHLLLHSSNTNDDEYDKDKFNFIEKAANMFASAFLLPKESFINDIKQYSKDIDYYIYLKKKWRVSMQAMIFRARQLKIITGNQFAYMMRQISKKGWRKHEPNDVPGKINDTIFQGILDKLFQGEYLSSHDFRMVLARNGIFLSDKDLIELLGLKENILEPEPVSLDYAEIESNVIPFNIKN